MRKIIFLDDNMKELFMTIDKKTAKCNIFAKLENGGKRLLLQNISSNNAYKILVQGAIHLQQIKLNKRLKNDR